MHGGRTRKPRVSLIKINEKTSSISFFSRKSHATLTTSLSRKSSVSFDQPSISNRFIQKSFRNLIGRFNDRTKRMRNRLEIPPTPPTSSGNLSACTPQHQKILFGTKNDDDDDVVVIEALNDEKSLVGKQLKTVAVEGPSALEDNVKTQHSKCSIFCCCSGPVLDPQGRFYISWLFVVTLSFLYNAFVIPLRTAFPFQTPENQQTWFIMDCLADLVYVMDLLFIKHRTMYLYEGELIVC